MRPRNAWPRCDSATPNQKRSCVRFFTRWDFAFASTTAICRAALTLPIGSENGPYLYMDATGTVTPGAGSPRRHGATLSSGKPNLIVTSTEMRPGWMISDREATNVWSSGNARLATNRSCVRRYSAGSPSSRLHDTDMLVESLKKLWTKAQLCFARASTKPLGRSQGQRHGRVLQKISKVLIGSMHGPFGNQGLIRLRSVSPAGRRPVAPSRQRSGLDLRLPTSRKAPSHPSRHGDAHGVADHLPTCPHGPTAQVVTSLGPVSREPLQPLCITDVGRDDFTTRHPDGWRRRDADSRTALERRYGINPPTEATSSFGPVEAIRDTLLIEGAWPLLIREQH